MKWLRRGFGFLLVQRGGEELDLLGERTVAVDDDQILSFEAAAAALGVIADFAEQLFGAHFDIMLLGRGHQLFEESFVAVFSWRAHVGS